MKDKELQKIAFNGALIETTIELIKYAIIIGIAIELVGILYHLL